MGLLGEALARPLDEHARSMGLIASLMSTSRAYRAFPLASLRVWVEPALFHEQYRVFFDQRGNAIGYVTWAFLADDVVDRVQDEPSYLMHLSEWNEGGDPYIIDFLVVPHLKWAAVRKMREEMFLEHDVIRAFRRRQDGKVTRIRAFHRSVRRDAVEPPR